MVQYLHRGFLIFGRYSVKRTLSLILNKPLPKGNRLYRRRPTMASYNHPVRLHRTTGTIAGIVAAIAGITTLLASTSC